MKNYLIPFLILVLFPSMYAKKKQVSPFYETVQPRTVITGTITNWNDINDLPKDISLHIEDVALNAFHVYTISIKDNGDFVFDVPLFHNTDANLEYGYRNFIDVFLFVNDSIHLNMQAIKIPEGISYRGNFDNNEMDLFQQQFSSNRYWLVSDNIYNFYKDSTLNNLSTFEYRDALLRYKQEMDLVINERVMEQNLPKLISDYLHLTLQYELYNHIIKHSKSKLPVEEKKNFFDAFLNDSIVFNSDAIITNYYCRFLNSYRMEVEERIRGAGAIPMNEENRKLSQKELMTKSLRLRGPSYIQLSKKQREGIWGEILAASELFSFDLDLEESPFLLPSEFYAEIIDTSFTNAYIRNFLLEQCRLYGDKMRGNKLKNIPKESVLEQSSSDNVVRELCQKHKGKVMYIDIWATWCGPCRQQFKYATQLQAYYEQKDVVFVYLCNRSEQTRWKEVIANYEIAGEHYLLTNEQFMVLEKEFSIMGIPRYILIDKTGKVVDRSALHPEYSTALRQQIDALIEQ